MPEQRTIWSVKERPVPTDRWVIGWDAMCHEWRDVSSSPKTGYVYSWEKDLPPDSITHWMEMTPPNE